MTKTKRTSRNTRIRFSKKKLLLISENVKNLNGNKDCYSENDQKTVSER